MMELCLAAWRKGKVIFHEHEDITPIEAQKKLMPLLQLAKDTAKYKEGGCLCRGIGSSGSTTSPISTTTS